MNKNPKVHVTFDTPLDLLNEVDACVEHLGINRSIAIRQGLRLFLQSNCHKMTKSDNRSDGHLSVPVVRAEIQPDPTTEPA